MKSENYFDDLIDAFRLIVRLRIINNRNQQKYFYFDEYNGSELKHEL